MHIISYYRNANQNHNEYHYTLTRMAEMKETDWQECAAAIFSYIAGESVVVQPLWKENSLSVPYKVKHILNI